MWPMLLDLTLDDCRRTLRSLELEAYANIMSVFRAQGPLEENRKKILEDLRGVLHISNDRHSAEARRVSNDELLATIADRLYGPYTNLGWICEGRRRVPLLPRAVPQAMYAELADRVAAACRKEDAERRRRLRHEPPPNVEKKEATVHETEELGPVAMEDPTIKLWDTELISRKRKVTEPSGDAPTQVKNIRNIPVNPNQKHVNLSQIYSKLSHQATSKPSQSKHSYNQVSKVSTSKSSHATARVHKQRSHKIAKSSAQHMAAKQRRALAAPPPAPPAPPPPAPCSALAPTPPAPADYGPPNTFQASYAASVLAKQSPPAATPVSHAPHAVSGKPSQLVIKKRGELATTDTPRAPRPIESIKLLSSRPLVVSPRPAPPAKLLATKVLGSLPRARVSAAMPASTAPAALHSEKMVVVSAGASAAESRPPPQRIVVTASGSAPRCSDALTPKGIPAPDLKVSAKTFVLNPKSGQKMVVVPAKQRPKSGPDGPSPVLHLKGAATPMKLVSVAQPASKAPVPRPVQPAPYSEPIRTANMADIVPVKASPVPVPVAPKTAVARLASPLARPGGGKAGVIVVQKGAALGKALTFTKNGGDVSKIIMGKNVSQLLQAAKEPTDTTGAGNVIVLELNNEQSARATTVSEILGRGAGAGTGQPGSQPAAVEARTTDWELALDAAGGARDKPGDDKLNSLHLDLGMSSDSDADFLPGPAPPASPPASPPRPPVTQVPLPSSQTGSSGPMSLATRTLLSQLQDEGSSSNDSSFALRAKPSRSEAESDALAQAKEKLTEKVAADKARLRRIDVFSTAIAPADLNLDTFSYLEDDDEFEGKRPDALHDQLSRLLDEVPVPPLSKQ